ncbi:uncharacterized protein LOC5518053 [Nematostella vectensis]|uniref:uncharacterized protein LOC5518053 n=1 Tax=Nematostella vectensis TaxID=45351 RepID=UPI002076DF75|nr:uncharacterized protein LOC5518053 [Nematostella vectensis]
MVNNFVNWAKESYKKLASSKGSQRGISSQIINSANRDTGGQVNCENCDMKETAQGNGITNDDVAAADEDDNDDNDDDDDDDDDEIFCTARSCDHPSTSSVPHVGSNDDSDNSYSTSQTKRSNKIERVRSQDSPENNLYQEDRNRPNPDVSPCLLSDSSVESPNINEHSKLASNLSTPSRSSCSKLIRSQTSLSAMEVCNSSDIGSTPTILSVQQDCSSIRRDCSRLKEKVNELLDATNKLPPVFRRKHFFESDISNAELADVIIAGKTPPILLKDLAKDRESEVKTKASTPILEKGGSSEEDGGSNARLDVLIGEKTSLASDLTEDQESDVALLRDFDVPGLCLDDASVNSQEFLDDICTADKYNDATPDDVLNALQMLESSMNMSRAQGCSIIEVNSPVDSSMNICTAQRCSENEEINPLAQENSIVKEDTPAHSIRSAQKCGIIEENAPVFCGDSISESQPSTAASSHPSGLSSSGSIPCGQQQCEDEDRSHLYLEMRAEQSLLRALMSQESDNFADSETLNHAISNMVAQTPRTSPSNEKVETKDNIDVTTSSTCSDILANQHVLAEDDISELPQAGSKRKRTCLNDDEEHAPKRTAVARERVSPDSTNASQQPSHMVQMSQAHDLYSQQEILEMSWSDEKEAPSTSQSEPTFLVKCKDKLSSPEHDIALFYGTASRTAQGHPSRDDLIPYYGDSDGSISEIEKPRTSRVSRTSSKTSTGKKRRRSKSEVAMEKVWLERVFDWVDTLPANDQRGREFNWFAD